jgi:hypothetical protein
MDTEQDVARKVEVLCLCLPGDEQLISLLFDQGLASELPHDGIEFGPIDTSSMHRRLAQPAR